MEIKYYSTEELKDELKRQLNLQKHKKKKIRELLKGAGIASIVFLIQMYQVGVVETIVFAM